MDLFNLMPTFMFDFPPGAYLGFFVGIATIILASLTMFIPPELRKAMANDMAILAVMVISILLVVGSLGTTPMKAKFDSYIRNSDVLPQPFTPGWAIGLLLAVIIGTLAMSIHAMRQQSWVQASMYGALMFVAGAAFSEALFYRLYADGFALSNSICWIGAGIMTIVLVVRASMAVRSRSIFEPRYPRAHLNA